MFIIGKANKFEIKEMEKLGFTVEKVNMEHFDKALGQDEKDYKEDGKYLDGDELVAVYLDCDIVKECRSIIALEKLVNVVTGD